MGKYSRFVNLSEIQKDLNKVKDLKEIKKGGLPVGYDNKGLYVDEQIGHNLVIGSTGSGKTQSVTYPKLETSINSGESFIITDEKEEDYETFKDKLKDYKIVKYDFNNFKGDSYNPFELVYKLYQDNNLDDAVYYLEQLASFVIPNTNENSDPFWIETARNVLVGTTLYFIDKEKRCPNLIDIINYEVTDSDFNKLDSNNPAKITLNVVMNAPKETKGSILAVYHNAVTYFNVSNNLKKFLEKNTFDLNDLLTQKVAVFFFGVSNRETYNLFVTMFIEQVMFLLRNKNKQRINIILDDFDNFNPINNLEKLLNTARSNYIEFTILVSNLNKLCTKYSEAIFNAYMSCFTRIIYLMCQDDMTLRYISKICGETSNGEPLISPMELKLFNYFECLIIKVRNYPFKTKLLPYYQYKSEK